MLTVLLDTDCLGYNIEYCNIYFSSSYLVWLDSNSFLPAAFSLFLALFAFFYLGLEHFIKLYDNN